MNAPEPHRAPVRPADVVGVVLAGGEGRRLGGDKAVAPLAGRPLLDRPLGALTAVLGRVAVVARRDSVLPRLPAGVERWDEPDGPRHPAAGIAHALRRAGGPVFACAADLALLDAATVRVVLAAAVPGGPGAVGRADGAVQPLCALYAPTCGPALATAARDGGRLLDVVAALGLHLVELPEPDAVHNVNTPGDLRRAEALLAARDARAL